MNNIITWINADIEDQNSDSGFGDAEHDAIDINAKEQFLASKSTSELGCLISASHYLGLIELYESSLNLLAARLNSIKPNQLRRLFAVASSDETIPQNTLACDA